MQKISLFIIISLFLFSACTEEGTKKSPIDISNSEKNEELIPIYNDYYFVDNFTVKNAGNYFSIKVDDCFLVIPEEESYLGKEVFLEEIQIKSPSEHTIEGEHFPLEFQFVHNDSTGKTTIASVMAKEGEPNPEYQVVLDNMPQKNKTETIKKSLDVYFLFSQSPEYWHYVGSTTSKPYIDSVKWFIMKEPVELSKEQIDKTTEIIGENEVETVEIGERKIIDL